MKQRLFATEEVKRKLKNKHEIEWGQVLGKWQSFSGTTLEDTREEHKTNPPTEWFVYRGLKVVFIESEKISNTCILKTAYPANEDEIRIFENNSWS